MPAVSREHHSHAVCSNNKAVREQGTQGAAPELSCTIKLSTGSLHIVVLAVLWSHLLLLWDNGASPGGSNEGNMQGCRGRVQQRSNIVAVYKGATKSAAAELW
jgi:hypothetical protein